MHRGIVNQLDSRFYDKAKGIRLAICVGASQISLDDRRKFVICVALSRKTLRNGD